EESGDAPGGGPGEVGAGPVPGEDRARGEPAGGGGPQPGGRLIGTLRPIVETATLWCLATSRLFTTPWKGRSSSYRSPRRRCSAWSIPSPSTGRPCRGTSTGSCRTALLRTRCCCPLSRAVASSTATTTSTTSVNGLSLALDDNSSAAVL
ncbi:unnamed protein product, partial [Ectocarpus sp. 6 AP-2014]